MGNFVYSLIWMVLLVFVVWPVAWFLSAVWIILQVSRLIPSFKGGRKHFASFCFSLVGLLFFTILKPFEACFNIVVTINQYIEKFVVRRHSVVM
jgi:hypothetical protein